MRSCVHACDPSVFTRSRVHACVHAFMPVFMRSCLCSCVHAFMPVFMRSCLCVVSLRHSGTSLSACAHTNTHPLLYTPAFLYFVSPQAQAHPSACAYTNTHPPLYNTAPVSGLKKNTRNRVNCTLYLSPQAQAHPLSLCLYKHAFSALLHSPCLSIK